MNTKPAKASIEMAFKSNNDMACSVIFARHRAWRSCFHSPFLAFILSLSSFVLLTNIRVDTT
jgi:hypothetical protein